MTRLKADALATIWNRNFICTLFSTFTLSTAHFSINPLIASYAVHLGASAYLMGLLTGLFFGVVFSMRPKAGPVPTKIDKRKLMILVFFIGVVANIGYALFDSISGFIAFRLLHGLQYAWVDPAGSNIWQAWHIIKIPITPRIIKVDDFQFMRFMSFSQICL